MSNNTKEFKIIGVDVAKAKLDIALDDKTIITIKNNNESYFKKLLAKFSNKESVCFVMDASGGYKKVFANFLITNGIEVAGRVFLVPMRGVGIQFIPRLRFVV